MTADDFESLRLCLIEQEPREGFWRTMYPFVCVERIIGRPLPPEARDADTCEEWWCEMLQNLRAETAYIGGWSIIKIDPEAEAI